MNQLQINQLSHTYPNGVKAMHDITLSIGNGMFGLLGPNGAGKSTLMRTLAGLQQPNSGTIFFNNTDVLRYPALLKQQLGYLPQDFGVYPKISAWQLLEHLAILKGVNHKAERKEQVAALLQKTNLYEHRHKYVYNFSGGMKQRFGIAQALLGNPQLVIVDEPTAGLDPEERHRFNNLLSEIGEQIIVILSTHIVEDVRNLCTRMAIINHGQVLASGAPDSFINALQGRIWRKTISKNEWQQYAAQYTILYTRLNGGRPTIHIWSATEPGNGFSAATPDLEDVYFTQLRKN
jgi:ABC-type multidrug transport system ATPase subunit